MNKSQSRSSAIEPDSFYSDPRHYAFCSNQGGELPCDECNDITDEIRADFKAARYELERGN